MRWSGVLERVERNVYDFAFGIGTGPRLTLALAGAEGGYLGRGPVRAVVRTSADDAAMLAGAVGAVITFSGDLVACDPFGRRIFVAEAEVEPLAASH